MGYRLYYRFGSLYRICRFLITMTQVKKYNTLKKMNRPIRFFGLSSLQFFAAILIMMIVVIIMIFAKANSLAIIGVIFVFVIAFTFLFAELNKAHKAGNPDYLAGKNIQSATPRKIVDKNKFFNLIKF